MTAVLYDYWRSSAAWRVRIGLNLAGIAYEAVPVNLLADEHRGAANRARNPQGLVPTLEIDGLVLTQSLAILEYIDETRGVGFLPRDPVQRARARALAHLIAMDIHPVCNLSVARFATHASGGGIDMPGWMQEFIPRGLAAFEALLDGKGPCCVGATVSLADICLVPQLYNARRWEVTLPALPRILAVAAHLETLPAFAAAHPDWTGPPPG